jgi:hypothetical protein
MEPLYDARTIMADPLIKRLVYQVAHQVLVERGITIDELIFQNKDGQDILRLPVPDAPPPELAEPGADGVGSP